MISDKSEPVQHGKNMVEEIGAHLGGFDMLMSTG